MEATEEYPNTVTDGEPTGLSGEMPGFHVHWRQIHHALSITIQLTLAAFQSCVRTFVGYGHSAGSHAILSLPLAVCKWGFTFVKPPVIRQVICSAPAFDPQQIISALHEAFAHLVMSIIIAFHLINYAHSFC